MERIVKAGNRGYSEVLGKENEKEPHGRAFWEDVRGEKKLTVRREMKSIKEMGKSKAQNCHSFDVAVRRDSAPCVA